MLRAEEQPVIALKTIGGGSVHKFRDFPGAAGGEYLQRRAVEVAPIFESSGVKSWTEFCVRFSLGIPNVLATIGATAKVGHLEEFLAAKEDVRPLPCEIMDEIFALQRRWSDEMDVRAEPWTM